jgi:predicted phosphodiesterase
VRYLLISDLHGNWEALEAVLADARGEYDLIVCCGDLVGYGPDPNRVIDWAREHLHAVIRGNHDRACCGQNNLEWFNPVARAASLWTMMRLTPENLQYLRDLPQGPLPLGDFLVAHGSPLDEDEYVISPSDAANLFNYLESNLTFFGHTHLQGGFVWLNGLLQPIRKPGAAENSVYFRIDPNGAYLINPGSVGQPRDGDARAAYALFDTDRHSVVLARAVYDSEAVKHKIEEAGLPPALGSRLILGR